MKYQKRWNASASLAAYSGAVVGEVVKRHDRQPSGIKQMKRAITCAIFSMCCSNSVVAGLIASDSMAYESGQSISLKNGGFGFGGEWRTGTGTATVSSPGLEYWGVSYAGNRIDVSGTGSFGRRLPEVFGDTDETYYFSVLVRPFSANSSGYFGIGLYDSSVGGDGIFFGEPGSGTNAWVISAGNGTSEVSSGIAPSTESVSLLVLRATYKSSTSDTFTLYVNPDVTNPEPTTGTTLNIEAGKPVDITAVFLGTDASFDEFRIGKTFESVTPEPSSLAILGVGVLLTTRRTICRKHKDKT